MLNVAIPRRKKWLRRLALSLVIMGTTQVCSAQDERAPTPGERFCITPNELPVVTQKAKQGDPVSIDRLFTYYIFCVGEDETGFFWLEKLGDTGDEEARKHMLYYLEHHSSPGFDQRAATLRARWGMPVKSR